MPLLNELKNDLWGVPFQYRSSATNPVLFGWGPDRSPGTADDVAILQADIAMSRSNGIVHAVILFRDGSRKIVHKQVKTAPSIRVDSIPGSAPRALRRTALRHSAIPFPGAGCTPSNERPDPDDNSG